MKFARWLFVVFLSALLAQSEILIAHHNRDWDSECQTEIYQVLKKFRDLEKKYEHKKQEGLTQEDLVEIEKNWNDYWSELAQLVMQCRSAYEFDLMQRVSELAKKEGRDDVASLIDVSCRPTKEVLSEVTQEQE